MNGLDRMAEHEGDDGREAQRLPHEDRPRDRNLPREVRQQVAELLGASTSRVITVWRSRHPDFPAPIVDRPLGRLWHRPDIEAWGRATGRIT